MSQYCLKLFSYLGLGANRTFEAEFFLLHFSLCAALVRFSGFPDFAPLSTGAVAVADITPVASAADEDSTDGTDRVRTDLAHPFRTGFADSSGGSRGPASRPHR